MCNLFHLVTLRGIPTDILCDSVVARLVMPIMPILVHI